MTFSEEPEGEREECGKKERREERVTRPLTNPALQETEMRNQNQNLKKKEIRQYSRRGAPGGSSMTSEGIGRKKKGGRLDSAVVKTRS